LDLGLVLSDEDNQSDIRNSGDPGITDQLGIERQQAMGSSAFAADRYLMRNGLWGLHREALMP
jgi:hypothetical protein